MDALTDKRRALTLLKDQIQQSDQLSNRDREHLLAFDNRMALLRSEYNPEGKKSASK